MATAESQTSRGRDPRAGGLIYGGFISYSHAADGLLAPRLQSGLQRFAKPWWKRRALRIFRDESSLSANPHLWSSITDALDQSDWFVLLLSPEAAESSWVNDEIEYWLECKDSNRIIPVLTGGDLAWSDNDFTSDAVPPALQNAFLSEPRWVDLRFADSEEQLDLSNPRFSAAVADIASAIRGVPKDELESEEVRQHRRTVRTAWAAGFALVFLAVVAAFFAVQSRRSADLAQSRQLAAAAVSVVEQDPELSLMLALTSTAKGGITLESEKAIRGALRNHRTLFYREPAEDSTAFWSSNVALSPDGSLVAVTWVSNRIEMWEVGSSNGEPLWAMDLPEGSHIEGQRFTTDGHWLASGVYWWDIDESDPTIPELPPDGVQTGLFIWDAQTGEVVRVIELECAGIAFQRGIHFFDPQLPVVIPPDTPLDNDFPAARACDTGDAAEEIEVVTVVDMRSGNILGEVTVPAHATLIGLGKDPAHLTVNFNGADAQLIDWSTGEIVGAPPEGMLDMSLDGTLYLAGPTGVPESIRDTATDSVIFDVMPGLPPIGLLTSDGQGVMTVAPGESGLVVRGTNQVTLSGHDGLLNPFSMPMSLDGSRVATSSADLTARVWNLEPIRGEVGGYDLPPGFRANAGADTHGDLAAVLIFPDSGPWLFDRFKGHLTEWAEGRLLINDRTTGDLLVKIEGVGGKVVRFSPDGTRVAAQSSGDDLYGPVWVFDAVSGEPLVEMQGMCHWAPEGGRLACSRGEGVPAGAIDLDYSSDGSMLAMAGGDSQRFIVWDPATGEPRFISDKIGNTYPLSAVQFSPSGDVVVVSSKQGSWVFDAADWEQVGFLSHMGAPVWALRFEPDGSRLVQAQAHTGDVATWDTETWDLTSTFEAGAGQIRDLEISPDSSIVATAHNDGLVAVHNLLTGDLLHVLPVGGDVTNIEFVDGHRHLLVTTAFGSVEVFTLDMDELLATARSRLIRAFTPVECAEFNLDPCPSYKELSVG